MSEEVAQAVRQVIEEADVRVRSYYGQGHHPQTEPGKGQMQETGREHQTPHSEPQKTGGAANPTSQQRPAQGTLSGSQKKQKTKQGQSQPKGSKGKIDINKASREDLTALFGIGDRIANR